MTTAKLVDQNDVDCTDRPQILWPCSMKTRPTMMDSEKATVASVADSYRRNECLELVDFKQQFEDVEQKLDLLTLQMATCLDCVGAIQRATQEWEHHHQTIPDHQTSPHEEKLLMRRQAKKPTTMSAVSAATFISNSDASELTTSRWRQAGSSPFPPPRTTLPLPSCAEAFQDGTIAHHNSMQRRSSMASDAVNAMQAMSAAHRRPAIATKAWNFLEDPDSSHPAYVFSVVWPAFTAVAAVASLAESFDLPDEYHFMLGAFNGFAEALFLIEASTRYAVFPTTYLFFKSFSCIVDVFAALAVFVRLPANFTVPAEGTTTLADMARYFLLCFVPMARLLKLLRSFQYSKLMKVVLESVTDALKFLVYVMLLILLLFSTIFLIVEPRTSVASLPEAIWYSVMTMTTVGFLQPESPGGFAASGVLMVLSVMYMSMPLGVLGNAFTQVWLDRDRILLIGTFRARLDQYGYNAKDMKTLFHHYNRSGDGEICMEEFRTMISDMQVGIADDKILSLYECIDKDGGGTIDDKEFVKAMFPEAFHEVFHSEKKKKKSRRSKPKGDLQADSPDFSLSPSPGSPK